MGPDSDKWEARKRDHFRSLARKNYKENYISLLYEAVDQALEEASPNDCRVFCYPIGVVAKELCNDLELQEDAFEHCKSLIQALEKQDKFVSLLSRSRITVAAALVYIAATLTGQTKSQWKVASTIGISTNTLGKCAKAIRHLVFPSFLAKQKRDSQGESAPSPER